MKKIIATCLLIAACGTSSSDNEASGQVKKIMKKTPIICPDYHEVHISLGIMRNGVGSMSQEDLVVAVDNEEKGMIDFLNKAAETGELVKIQYDVKRLALCWPDHRLTFATLEAGSGNGSAQ